MVAVYWICFTLARKTHNIIQPLKASIRLLTNAAVTKYDAFKDYSLDGDEKNILICGDGDLSYGACLAEKLNKSRPDVKILATVLESELEHNQIFRDSERNIETIRKSGHEVAFKVDATHLNDLFPHNYYHRIQWNFPHWKGKTNNKRNRHLMSEFFRSSCPLLADRGQIHLALLDHQGGMRAKSSSEWKRSWLTPQYAADHELLLTHHLDFTPFYNLSAYQFRDRPFCTGEDSRTKSNTYIYTKNGGKNIIVPKDIQMYSSFTLYLSLPYSLPCSANFNVSTANLWTVNEILDIHHIEKVVNSKVPYGIRPEVKLYRILRSPSVADDWTVVEYNVALFGESIPINMSLANKLKMAIEDEIQIMTQDTRRGGWPASNILPSSVYFARGWF